ncbi:MAG: condensation domain-containing protein [Rhodococcus sp. (in: high G+C Gram-positive bacteria)]
MIITALRNWTPQPGTVIEWHPADDVESLVASAGIDPVPASFLQENHVLGVHAAAARGSAHTAFLGSATELSGDLDIDALTRAFDAFLLRHDGLQTSFDVSDGAVVRRRVPPEAVRLQARTVGDVKSSEEFLDYVRARLSRDATPLSWPAVAFGAIAREGSFTLYYGSDHAFSDGASQVLVLSELADLYRAETSGTPATDISAWTGSFVDYVGIENDIADRVDADSPEVAAWADVVTAHGGSMPSFPLDLGLEPGETAPVEPIEIDLLDADGADAFEAASRAAGGKFVTGLLTAIAITDHEVAGKADYAGITVLGTRHLGNFAMSQGWFCNFAPVAFPVQGATRFSDLVPRAAQAYAETKSTAGAPIGRILRLLIESGVGGAGLASSPHLLSYIDFRWFPGHGSEADDSAILFTGEGRTSNASMWFNRDESHFYLGAQTPSTDFAQEQVARYHGHLRTVLRSVARDGDYVIGLDQHSAPQARSAACT